MLKKVVVRRLAMAIAACTLVSLAGVGGANAEEEPSNPIEPVVTETVYTAEQVVSNVLANTVAAAQFVLEQALSGRLVDLVNVKTSVLPELTLVWEDGTQIGEAFVETATNPEDPNDVATGVGFETNDFAADPTVIGEDTGTGLKASSFSGSDYISGACYGASVSKGKMTYCGIKYRVRENSNSFNLYWYDRYVTAVGTAVNNAPDYWPVKIDIRTRPKSSGSNINAMLDYGPRGAVRDCSDSIYLSGTVGGWGATIPITPCSEFGGYPDGSTKTMRAVFDQGAHITGPRSRAAEMGVVYRTPAGVTANAAHYNYAKFCVQSPWTCGSVTATVGGW